MTENINFLINFNSSCWLHSNEFSGLYILCRLTALLWQSLWRQWRVHCDEFTFWWKSEFVTCDEFSVWRVYCKPLGTSATGFCHQRRMASMCGPVCLWHRVNSGKVSEMKVAEQGTILFFSVNVINQSFLLFVTLFLDGRLGWPLSDFVLFRCPGNRQSRLFITVDLSEFLLWQTWHNSFNLFTHYVISWHYETVYFAFFPWQHRMFLYLNLHLFDRFGS